MIPIRKYRNNPDLCLHERTKSLGTKYVRHRICLECCYHWYEGREYTHKQWEAWINDTEAKAKEIKKGRDCDACGGMSGCSDCGEVHRRI